MAHPLVLQLHFTRSEFLRAIKGVTKEEARKRFLPMNCISWNVGHLAWQEQQYFLSYGQGQILYPEIHRNFASGAPASTPSSSGRGGPAGGPPGAARPRRPTHGRRAHVVCKARTLESLVKFDGTIVNFRGARGRCSDEDFKWVCVCTDPHQLVTQPPAGAVAPLRPQ